MKTEIIYEDKELLVVRKPAGLATQTSRPGQADVASELRNYFKNPYIGVVHRLDQPVEGLLVFARTKAAAAALSGQLAEGILAKKYYAVICGRPEREQGTLVDHLYKDMRDEGRAIVAGEQDISRFADAKRAVLHFRLAEYVQEENLSLMEICIETGRFHQIRAQMSHAGMALLGDLKYADETVRERSGQLGIRQAALCAYSLEFWHPARKRKMEFHINPSGKAFSGFHFT